MQNEILTDVKRKAQQWLNGNIDEESKKQIRHLLENDENELVESFYRELEFGTGGLRGIMGVGTNRMNIYTVGMATQGLCNYLLKQFPNQEISVAFAHDSRNNGRLFCETAAQICSANGIKVYLFDALRPTPELSFAIRHLGCKSGVVVTASHNPKEYNGYKVYWEDGGQIIDPHDTNIIVEVQKITSVDEVKWKGNKAEIITIGDDIDQVYIQALKGLSLSPEAIKNQNQLKIVYTPIHGTGVKLVPMALKAIGFTNIIAVPEQNIPDGNFPTVHSPNPEESAALNMAIEKAKETGADLVMATDPDADRVGIAVKNKEGIFELLNGNQTGSFLLYYLLTKWKENGKLKGREYVVKTIVTTELIAKMANDFKVEYHDVLTGFKYIADIIKRSEGTKTFIGGGEESYGYLAADFVRDKDAVMSCMLIAEAAAWATDQGKSIFDVLADIYMKYGFYKEKLVNLVRKGKSGAEEIQQMMSSYRSNPPQFINGSAVIKIKDYQSQKEMNFITGTKDIIRLPKSNVLQFLTADGTIVSVRPSGTEPKIKFYIGTKTELKTATDYRRTEKELDEKLNAICKDLGI
ncbi:MAG TPA: phosphoglucomutase [Marinilabiliales bacterium]|nr:MAG: phosphoglucomutase [Bacteroidetes bacterium GWD2_40_43]OFX89602.1 MAG: phosphoglucomutase [Bacteroidetes bacterium GWE2_40_63]OFY24121.1 MAG: phosphoglucomutase [Bacteroidetes bacterium GWF2_40_13]OFZ26313.1 MAG: phosphoglucomutase [Bacteroidetes bacterium RIFOXYC2_FULL_40_12]HAM99533.1 phosphoglucomutase [Marinilabiliales bacterium]